MLTARSSPTLSLDIRPYCPSPQASFLDSIQYPHRSDVCMPLLVGEHWPVHKRTWLISLFISVFRSPAVLPLYCSSNFGVCEMEVKEI